MKFRHWLQKEQSTDQPSPERFAPPINRGSSTPGSDEVIRTGLQPQVGAEEIHTQEKDEQDKLMAADAAIKRLDTEIPGGKDEDKPRLRKLQSLWQQFKQKWERIKSEDETEPVQQTVTGSAPNMQGAPNMVPGTPQF